MTASAELVRELERQALGADEVVTKLRAELERTRDPGERRVLKLRISAAADEHARCLMALFQTPRIG